MVNNRLVTLGAALGVVWLGMVMRVFQIQVVQSGYYRDLAANQSLRRDILPPHRGEIFDRSGAILVVNVDRGAGAEEGFRGSRLCPNGTLAGQVLGMVSRDGYGQSGLEFHLDRDLRGTDGWRLVRHDARNRYAPGSEDRIDPPVDGLGVRLTLDAQVQSITELALERGVKRSGAKEGVAIVVDPATGDVLAMANYPFFNPNQQEHQNNDAWKNQAIVKVYEPGSTFKIITSAALLEEGLMKPNDTVDAEGGQYKIAGETISDTHPMHRISFTDALAYSSNISFAKMSMRLKDVVFYKYIRSFGFGMKTGLNLPAEETGWLQPVRDWSARSQPTLAFGHEIAVTPIQLAMAAAAIANDGVLVRPRLVRAWVDEAGRVVREEPTHVLRRVVSSATAATLRSMLQAVVDRGTAADIKHPYIPIAGKTGTAEKIDAATGKYTPGRFNSSFVGMAPADHPAFVCLVILDEPEQLKYGGQSAAPIFREILDRVAVEWNWVPERQTQWAVGRGDSLHSSNASSKPRDQNPSATVSATSMESAPMQPAPLQKAADSLASTLGSAANPVMPDLHNATLRDAMLRLRELGMDVDYSGEGRVVGQQPGPGKPIRRGVRCQLTLGWMG